MKEIRIGNGRYAAFPARAIERVGRSLGASRCDDVSERPHEQLEEDAFDFVSSSTNAKSGSTNAKSG
jgi:hypothetical protein